MFKINKKVEYALMVLKHFKDNPLQELVTARLVCDEYHTPFDTTSRVMQLMNNKEILGSSQGVKGGYKLQKPLSNISYLELLEVVEQRKYNKNCSDINCSLIESCNITGPIQNLNKQLIQFFHSITIEKLLDDETDEKVINQTELTQTQGEINEYRTR